MPAVAAPASQPSQSTQPPASQSFSSAPAPAGQASPAGDAQSLWQQLLETTRSKPALGWIRSLDCLHMQGSVMTLAIKPGQREMVRFFGDRQRAQLSQMISDLAQQQIKIELQLPTRQMLDESQGSSGAGSPSNDSTSPSGPGRIAITAVQRQAVMALPLVRELMETFDLSLVEVRKHIPGKPVVDEDESDDESSSTKPSILDDMNDNDDLDALDGMDETDEFD